MNFFLKKKRFQYFKKKIKKKKNVLGDDDGEDDNGDEEQKQEEDDDNNFDCDDDDSFGCDDEDDDEGETKEESRVVSVPTNNCYLSGRFICKFCGNDYASSGSLHNHLYYKPSRPYAKLCGSIRK